MLLNILREGKRRMLKMTWLSSQKNWLKTENSGTSGQYACFCVNYDNINVKKQKNKLKLLNRVEISAKFVNFSNDTTLSIPIGWRDVPLSAYCTFRLRKDQNTSH